MNELPEKWASCTLGQLAGNGQYGWTTKAAEKGTIKFLRTTDITKGSIDWESVPYCLEPPPDQDKYELQSGDILISRAGSVGYSVLLESIPHPAIFASYLIRFLPNVDVVIPRYLSRFLQSPKYWEQIAGAAAGIALANVNASKLAELDVPLAPFNEQKRIADKLDAVLGRVNACRAGLDRVPAILKRFRQSVLGAATSGKLTADWRHGNRSQSNATKLAQKVHGTHMAAGGHKVGNAAPPTEDVHDLTVDMFPRGWGLLTLRDLVMPDRPITYGILKPGPELQEGIPYVRVADFPGEKLNLTSIRKTSPKIDEVFKRSRLRSGDLLLSIRGTVGRLIVVPNELENANITQDSARLSIQPFVNRHYVLWYLRSELAQSRMKGSVKGVAVRGINIGDVRALQVALPSREEQDEIVRRIDALFRYADRLEAIYKAALDRVEQLTPAVLTKAFRGELVSQDPNDEPAAVLLERIRAVRSVRRPKRPSRSNGSFLKGSQPEEIHMLNKKEIRDRHLTDILKEQGPLTAEALWSASNLEIDDFYDKLKDEEARGLLKEKRSKLPTLPRLLEAIA